MLYKAGRVKEAIEWEEKALADLKAENNPFWDKQIKEYSETIEKMKMGEPIYVEQGAIWTESTLPKKIQNLRR